MKLQKLLNGRSPEASPQASPKSAVDYPPKLESETDDEVSTSEGGVRVKTPTEYDVLFGRGKPYQGHPGNMRLHRFANAYKKRYSMARRHEKTEIAEEIVSLVKTEGGKHGRFLKRSTEAGDEYWIEVSDSVARDKVSHALRGKSRKDELSTGLSAVDNSKALTALKKRTPKAGSVSEPTSKKQRLSPSAVASTELLNSLEEQRILNSISEQRMFHTMTEQRNVSVLSGASNGSLLGGSLQMELQARQLMSSIMAERQLAAFGGTLGASQFGYESLLRQPGLQGLGAGFGGNLLHALRAPQPQLDPRLWY